MATQTRETNITSHFYIAVMQCVEGLGAMGIRRLIAYYKTPKAAWQALLTNDESVYALGIKGIKPNTSERTMLESLPTVLKKQLEYWDIHFVTYLDAMYPPQLKDIYNPPAVLFYRGSEKLLRTERGVAMVGARKCTQYGRNVAAEFSYELGQKGVVVISGGARGIDGCSHMGALHAKAPTIAVMGCGLDTVYPREHAKLFRDILLGGGTLVSEYPPGVKPLGNHFPMRNRIISGLAKAVVVVEAKASSGSLITADIAINDGRDVFAVPGNVLSGESEGTNWLLRQGAMVLTHTDDIIEEYDWAPKESKQACKVAGVVKEVKNHNGNSDDTRKSTDSGTEKIKKESSHNSACMLSCSLEEKKVLQVLSYSTTYSVNEILEQTDLSLSSLHTVLLQLELKGLVEQSSPGNYIMLTLGRNQFVD